MRNKKANRKRKVVTYSGLFNRLVEDAPFHYTSPNAPEFRDVVGTTVLAIVCGFTRYVYINRLRNDTVLAALLGLDRIVCEDSVRRALKSADGRELDAWLARHERDVFDKLLSCQYVIDIDNTVKSIFGHQKGAELGYNPQKPGRPSHNFHSYFIGLIRISLGMDVLPGNRHSGTCGMPRLWEIIDGLLLEKRPRLLRGDVGYGGDENMCEAEKRGSCTCSRSGARRPFSRFSANTRSSKRLGSIFSPSQNHAR